MAFDDTGRRFGPVDYSLNALQTRYFNSRDLENGSDRRLPRGVGNGTGNWRLELTADVDIEPLGYSRSPDGFLTGMNALAVETQQGSTWHYRVPFFQEQSIDGHRSRLRLINPGERTASVTIAGVDDIGVAGDTSIRLTIRARAAVMLTTEQLERGDGQFSGRLGDGGGRWQLTVSSDARLHVMGLVKSRSGHLTNLSRGTTGAAGTPPPPPPPPPENYGAHASDVITGCRGFAWGIAVNRRSAQEALSAAVGECQSRGGSASDCNRFSDSLATGRCVGMAYGRNPGVDCGSKVWTANSVIGAEFAAMTDCRNDFSVCIIPSDARGRASGCNAQGGSGADGAEDTPVLQLEVTEQWIP